MTALVLRIAIVGMILVVAGCREDLTEVVVAIESDLIPGTEVDQLMLTYMPGNQAPPMFGFSMSASVDSLSPFPMSAGFASSEDGPASFSIAVQLTKFNEFESAIVVSRKATAIQFVREQVLMLVLKMSRACACQGTTCPNPGTIPDCDDVVNPGLVPLDPAVAPRGREGNVIDISGSPATRPSAGGGSVGPPPP